MKKIYTLLISTVIFFLLIFLVLPVLVGGELIQENDNNDENENQIDLTEIQELLNDDNLYENYIHHYTIKIPEGYKIDKGIGKFSSVQFYNEELQYVVGVNVGETDFGDTSNSVLLKTLQENPMFSIDMEKSLYERGFKYSHLEKMSNVVFNNRKFLKVEFTGSRKSNFEKNIINPDLINLFITFHRGLVYNFMFINYDSSSVQNWKTEIEKSMMNVFISEYITPKNRLKSN